jgi:hypothetical protein
MVRRITITWLLFIFSIPCFSQQVTDSAYTKTVSAFPDDKIASNRRIVLLTTDTFIVYSSFDIIIDNLKKFIAEYDVEEDKNLLNKFLNTSKSLEGNLQDIRKLTCLNVQCVSFITRFLRVVRNRLP